LVVSALVIQSSGTTTTARRAACINIVSAPEDSAASSRTTRSDAESPNAERHRSDADGATTMGRVGTRMEQAARPPHADAASQASGSLGQAALPLFTVELARNIRDET